MAYAHLAGLPPIYGLYACLIPIIAYALFGTSRHLSVGPVAITSILVAGGLSQFAEPFSQEYISYAIAIGLCAGIIQLLMGIFRLGAVTHFLSYPVILGFTTAAVFIISCSQLGDATGVDLSSSKNILSKIYSLIIHIKDINIASISLFVGAIALIKILLKIHNKIPGTLIVVVLSIGLSYYWLQGYGIAIIGTIPNGLPEFVLPSIDIDLLKSQWVTIGSLAVIGIVENLGIARTLEAKHQTYRIKPNQELIAIGLSRVMGSFFQSLPTSASFSRSAINDTAGAKSTVSSLISVFMVILTLLFFTEFFYYLPKAILAAIIVVSIFGLIRIKEIRRLYQISPLDFGLMSITFITTLLAGITYGVLFGVVVSLLVVLYKSSTPGVKILGNLPGTTYYKNLKRYDEAEELPGILILRFDDQLFFGNCNYFKEIIEAHILDSSQELQNFVLDAGNIHRMDSSGVKTVEEVNEWLLHRNINFHIARAIGPVRDILYKSGLLNNPDHHHMNIQDAVNTILSQPKNEVRFKATQTNER